ncbi:hypothetical protein HPP92_019381 [Vanilla planifolia]|uniref:Uncharacterized protein n=1 Tax=Vanilla planifolia TaxID=51239 RepID=A0A835UIV6_VANPL|nr:hypothetical protein HPP92_019381 [Vanilla planifolia]
MGSCCSRGSAVDKSPSDITINASDGRDHAKVSASKSNGNSMALHAPAGETVGKRSLEQSFSFSEGVPPSFGGIGTVSEVGSLLGRASTAGFGKAVEVLDTLGSSMTS